MRRLPLLAAGTLLLPLGLLPAAAASGAAASGTAAEPVPSVSVSVTPTDEPEPTEDPEPEPSVTDAPENPDEETPDEETPEDEFLTGTLTRSPATGPAGTEVKVASKDECVDADGTAGGTVDVIALGLGDLDDIGDLEELSARAFADDEPGAGDVLDEGYVEKVLDTKADGSWATTLAIPKSADTGELWMVIAACFEKGADVTDEDTLPYLVYEPLDFTVTGAPKAPVAEPVPGDPAFTG